MYRQRREHHSRARVARVLSIKHVRETTPDAQRGDRRGKKGRCRGQVCTCRSTQPAAYNTRLPAMAFASKKDDEGLSAYYNNKTTILQEARIFNDSPISPRKCRALLTRVVHLLYIGETFSTQEATTLFFGTTKLFQNKDVRSYCIQRVGCIVLTLRM